MDVFNQPVLLICGRKWGNEKEEETKVEENWMEKGEKMDMVETFEKTKEVFCLHCEGLSNSFIFFCCCLILKIGYNLLATIFRKSQRRQPIVTNSITLLYKQYELACYWGMLIKNLLIGLSLVVIIVGIQYTAHQNKLPVREST